MGKAQINFRVDEAQKDDWEQYVKESGKYSTLSGLIRAAVEREIHEEHSSPETEAPGIASDVHELMGDVERIRKDVSWLREQHQDAVDISEVAQQVQDTLEPLPQRTTPIDVPEDGDMDEMEFRRYQAAQEVIMPRGEEDKRHPQRARDIADQVDVTPQQVRDAIDYLQDQFLPVVEVEVDGETHYFMEAQ